MREGPAGWSRIISGISGKPLRSKKITLPKSKFGIFRGSGGMVRIIKLSVRKPSRGHELLKVSFCL
jgi:hypothetical protein